VKTYAIDMYTYKQIPPIHSKGWTMLWYHSVVSDISQREHKLDITQREPNLLWYHSVTPSSHTYPSQQVHQHKYVMKSYYDMIQLPKYS